MKNSPTPILLLGLIALLAALGILAWQGDWLEIRTPPKDAAGEAGTPPPVRAPELPPLPRVAGKQPDRVTPWRRQEIPPGQPYVPYPDGTYLPPLNGVKETLDRPLSWLRGRPYAPVVGRIELDGIEWYVHADGCRSTTRYPVEEKRNGKVVENPSPSAIVVGPAAPVKQTGPVRTAPKKDGEKLPVER